MYSEKLEPLLQDVENKEIEIAGGSIVAITLASINSLIKYISNLTLGKKKYEEVQEEILNILEEAEKLKKFSLNSIDKDKEILEKILKEYKTKKENEKKYEEVCKDGVEFCVDVLNCAFDTLKLAIRISKVGNRMLASDFKICKYYAMASVESAIVNIDINLSSVTDEEYKENIRRKYKIILEEARRISE